MSIPANTNYTFIVDGIFYTYKYDNIGSVVNIDTIGIANADYSYNVVVNTTSLTISNTTLSFTLKSPTLAQVNNGSYYLNANGSWVVVSGNGVGGVSEILTGNGLSGGPITTTGTIELVPNTGLVVNSTGIFVNSGYIATLTANNSSFLNGKAESALNVNSALTANNSSFLNGKAESALNVNNALTANNSSFLNGKAESALNVNNALTANNSAYLEGIQGNSYVQNTDSRVLSGNLSFSGSNINFTGTTLTVTANLVISGLMANGSFGSATQVLTSNGSSTYWSTPLIVTPGGSNTQVQFNNSGVFGGSAGFTFTSTSNNLSVANTISATHFDNISDINVKENIETLSNSIDIIKQLCPVSFNFKNNEGINYGLIAQQVEQIIPDIVHKKGDLKTISSIQLIALLIDCIKSQQLQIDYINNHLNSLVILKEVEDGKI